MVGADAFRAPLKRLDERGNQLWRERLTGVLDREPHGPGLNTRRDPDGAMFRQVVDDRVVHEVRRHLQQQCMGADGGARVAGGFDGEAVCFCEREKRFSGLFRDQRQVDLHSGEGPLVGAAEQEQCLGEVDRSRVDQVEAVDELAGIAIRIVAGHVEQCPGDRQWGAQFVGGVGCESALFADMSFDPFEHRVEGVGELAELISAARQPDAVGE